MPDTEWNAVPWGLGSDAALRETESTGRFAVGDTVLNSYVPPSRGTITAVDETARTVGIDWLEGYGPIVYPMDAHYLRKAMPWE